MVSLKRLQRAAIGSNTPIVEYRVYHALTPLLSWPSKAGSRPATSTKCVKSAHLMTQKPKDISEPYPLILSCDVHASPGSNTYKPVHESVCFVYADKQTRLPKAPLRKAARACTLYAHASYELPQKLVEVLSKSLQFMLNKSINFKTATSGDASSSPSTSSSCARVSCRQTTNTGQKRKQWREESDGSQPPDDDPGHGPNENPSIDPPDPPSGTSPRFACPYFKRDPQKQRNIRSCTGPGWDTVHRVK
jgi:hypothetical protein